MDLLTCDTCRASIQPDDWHITDEAGTYCEDCEDTYVNTMMQRAREQVESGVIYLDDHREHFYAGALPY